MHDLHVASSGYWRAASPAYGRVLGQRDYAGRRYKFAGYHDVIILREVILEEMSTSWIPGEEVRDCW